MDAPVLNTMGSFHILCAKNIQIKLMITLQTHVVISMSVFWDAALCYLVDTVLTLMVAEVKLP